MPTQNSDLVTRRKWLGTLSAHAAAATLGSVALSSVASAAESTAPATRGRGNDAGARWYNIRDFGAKGDGATLDTAALQAAIDACANDGGGTVLVPAGTFVIGTTELKSNITLHLAAAATLLGSGDGKQYHAIDAIPLSGDSTLGDGNWALLYAVNAKNIVVEGPGLIDGQGHLFNSFGLEGKLPPAGISGAQRPYHLLFHRCENLVVRDLDLVRCAFHSIRVIQSKRVRMEGLYIHNRVTVNNDGFHFISAEYVTITNCTILCQDDACALFGSCQNVVVTNCVFSTRWSVFRFGGGRVRNISVSNCVIFDTYGCPIKVGAGQMQLENLSFSNITLQNVTGPIGIYFSGQGRNPAPEMTPFVRNLSFSHIRATIVTEPTMTYADMPTIGRIYPGEQFSCITLNAIGKVRIENVRFDDVHVTSAGGGTAELAAKRTVPESVPQHSGEYFGVWSQSPVGPPAYGLYARNVTGLTLNNVRFDVSAPDLRPAIVLDRVVDLSVNGLSVQGNPEAESVLRFTGVKDALLTASRVLTPSAAFLGLEGDANEAITVDGGDLSKAAKPLVVRNGASEKAVKLRV